MQVLLILVDESAHVLLTPSEILSEIDLDAIDGRNVNAEECPEHVRDVICGLFDNTGLTCNLPGPFKLASYLNPIPPFQVDRVITCYWP